MNEQNHSADAVIDSVVAGGVITLPYWAVALNDWLHLFLAFCGSILVLYRLWVMCKEIIKD